MLSLLTQNNRNHSHSHNPNNSQHQFNSQNNSVSDNLNENNNRITTDNNNLFLPEFSKELEEMILASSSTPANNALYGLSPTMQAAQQNPLAMIQSDQFPDILQHFPAQECKSVLSLLKNTNNSSLVNKRGPLGGYTALHWMCIKNECELVEFLVKECNADINAKANVGETPLFISIKNCNFLTIEFLIENGAVLNARDIYDRSIIHWSAYTGKV